MTTKSFNVNVISIQAFLDDTRSVAPIAVARLHPENARPADLAAGQTVFRIERG